MKQFTRTELEEILGPEFWPTINLWLGRGDGVAIYENQNLGCSSHGEKQFVSYGSPHCQLETKEPPQRLPDIGGHINWAFQLVGVYRGQYLIEKASHEHL